MKRFIMSLMALASLTIETATFAYDVTECPQAEAYMGFLKLPLYPGADGRSNDRRLARRCKDYSRPRFTLHSLASALEPFTLFVLSLADAELSAHMVL
jgi:hypothetical protein